MNNNKDNKALLGLLGMSLIINVVAGFDNISLERKVKMSEMKINNLKSSYEELIEESYKEGLKKAIVDRAYVEDRKYVEIETNRGNRAWDYFAVDDLVVATTEENEHILVDTNAHYYYDEVLDCSKIESFEDYLTNVYFQSNDNDTKECIQHIISGGEWNIETVDRDRLLDLGIDKTSYDILLLGSTISSDNKVTESIVNIENNKTYRIKR
jgi:hypothetical protein